MGRVILILGSIFCVALAIVIGNRMSVDATALVVGVACGVLASIPGSLLLIWAFYRRDQMLEAKRASEPSPHFPPIVVVNPGQGNGRSMWESMAYPPSSSIPLPGGARQFKVIGEMEDESPSRYLIGLSERRG